MLAMQPHTTHAPAAADGFLPHGFCYLWNKPLLLTHLWSDLLIGISYVVISFVLALLVHRARRDIPFSVVFVAFGLFIVTCGMTHFMEVWTLWRPVYWLSGGVKVVTAAASVATAVAMPFMLPKVHSTIRDAKLAREREVAAARTGALEESNAELTRLNASLHAALAEAEAERRAAEQARHAAEEANAARSSFLAVMSHELRTPLNAVIGYAELLNLGVTGPVTAAQAEQLGRIRGSASHLVGLIDQVLRFARLEAGRDEVRLEPFDAVAVARDAADMIAPLAAAKGLAFDVDVPDAPVAVRSDPQKLRQVLLNLLSNAAKYTPAGQIALVLETSSGAGATPGDGRAADALVVFRVRDTGIGVAPEHHEHIFDPFWQVSPALTRTVGGTGLGLSVSRQLARLLGGDLTVESAPGAGSTFVLTIPAVLPSSASADARVA
jgi:signal transduction histidine kinase